MTDPQELVDFLTERDFHRTRSRRLHRLPPGAYADPTCSYFFTLCARHHGRPFDDPKLAVAVIDALLWRRAKHHWQLFCYCLMPDHLHFIVQLPDHDAAIVNAGARGVAPVGVLDHLGDFKKYTTTQVWWMLGGKSKLWQASSYDCIIRYNDKIESAVDYVLHNPVRKGLVDEWADHPYTRTVDPWSPT